MRIRQILHFLPKFITNGELLDFCWCSQIQSMATITKAECLRNSRQTKKVGEKGGLSIRINEDDKYFYIHIN